VAKKMAIKAAANTNRQMSEGMRVFMLFIGGGRRGQGREARRREF
jgi:hypothetical protein